MKKLLLLITLLSIVSTDLYAQVDLGLMPLPVNCTRQTGEFSLSNHINVVLNSSLPAVENIANQLKDKIKKVTGYSVEITARPLRLKNTIHLMLNLRKDTVLNKEGYNLQVSAKGIYIRANEAAGLFNGMQTLMQLMPVEIECDKLVKRVSWKIPNVDITDYPRFKWRGILFDVVRHFYTVEQVKDFIDRMARYKFNVLHLHLTDDQGWRLEIKSLPKLTQVGAWRAERTGRWGEFTRPTAEEPKTYGGFYTQDEMKELVKYAADRFISILPEIDVPGHSMAAVAAYPELSATPGTYQVNAGDKFMFKKEGGGFYGTIDNTLNPANEEVYRFLDKVFTEVAEIFPNEYIHIGGDECYKGFWEKNIACQQLMQKEGLKNEEELQSYFIKRVEKIVQSKGKKIIGWDEILEGGLAPDATVMSWRGMSGGIAAAKMNHKVIMTPNDFAYVDLYQGDPAVEPITYSMLRLNKAYSFDAMPLSVDPKYILGGQCNLWTERVPNMRHAQYMLWPRAFATIESLWTPGAEKDWKSFVSRVEIQFKRLDMAGINYSKSMYDPIINTKKESNGDLEISLDTEVSGLSIYYSFDETIPDRFYARYRIPIIVPKQAANLKIITYRGDKIIGKQISVPVAELERRAALN
ncbi:MAG TPA: family 20 glycosylhydrolase [Mucilaginibacter sp.]